MSDPAPAVPSPAAASPSASPAGGDVAIQVTADRTSVTVGDPITLRVRLTYPAGSSIRSFSPAASLGSLSLLDRTPGSPRATPDGRMEEVTVLKVAAYQLGAIDVPPLEATYLDRAGREGKASSEPLHLQVTSVLKPGETAPADIKPQAVMAERPVWPYVLLAVVLLGVGIWLWSRLRARRRPDEVAAAPAAPPRPPHEVAYEELERLLSSGWLEAGRLKELYIELAEILRRYLGARFAVETFEKTTTEILEALRSVRAPVKVTAMASQFFAACDLVKFAKYRPGLEETRDTVQKAYALVDETRPAAAEPAPAPAVAAGGEAR